MVSIGTYDAQILFNFIRSVSFILVVGSLILYILSSKPNNYIKKYSTAIKIAFSIWAAATMIYSSIQVYQYFEETRPSIKKSIQLQEGFAS